MRYTVKWSAVIMLLFASWVRALAVEASCIGSSPNWTAANATRPEVLACITAASPGDTINVPSGSATWSSPIDITKGVKLIGAGIGNTVITRGGSYIISYVPADYSANAAFRLSGFSFNGAGGDIFKLGRELYPDKQPHQTNIRIDQNRFYSASAASMNAIAIEYFGQMFGVVDNNIFESYPYPMRNQNPAGYTVLWDPAIAGEKGYTLFLPGSQYNLYFEDNTFNMPSTAENAITNSQYSGRYAYRYNTINLHGGQGWWLFDVHGKQDDEMHSPFGAEVYGNRLENNGNRDYGLIQVRGGQVLIHHNSATEPLAIEASATVVQCPPEPYRSLEMVHNTYAFDNRVNYTGALTNMGRNDTLSCGGRTRPTKGIDFFDQASSPGIGTGPLTSRPTTCSVGQAYWATNQSTNDLTGMVGKNPTTPISGTLYKCTSQNTWTAFYTPYAYPHPLRGGGSLNLVPAPPTNLTIR